MFDWTWGEINFKFFYKVSFMVKYDIIVNNIYK